MGQLQSSMQQVKGETTYQSDIAQLAGGFYTAFGSASGQVVWVRRMISTYLEPLQLGHALILPLVFLYYCFAGPRPSLLRPRWMAGLLFVWIGLAELFSISRGAILATLIGVAIVILMTRRVTWHFILFASVLLILVLVIPSVRGFVMNTLSLEDPSSLGHVSQLQSGWQLLLSQPWGLGLGQGGYVGTQFGAGQATGTAESFYFSTVSQVGVVGLGLLGLGFAGLLVNLRNAYRQSESRWLRATALVTLGALAGYSVSAIASEAAFGLLASAAVWFLAGVVVQLGLKERSTQRNAQLAVITD